MPTWDARFDLSIDLASPDLIQLVARAEALSGVVRGVPLPPHERERLDRLNILRAVRGTTGIEGSDLSDEEVAKVLGAETEAPVLPRSRSREEQEVRNADVVMRYIAETIRRDRGAPMTEQLIATIHRLTTAGIDYPNNSPGVYRSHGVHADTYVPPRDHAEVVRLMAAYAEWLNTQPTTSWPAPVRAVAAHFYFISVHPFGDGNGRTARAIESYLLYQGRINALGFYSLSNFYYRRRAEYVELLDYTRFQSSGDLTRFVCFGLRGLVEELEAVHAEVLDEVTWIAFKDYARERLLVSGRLRAKAGERMYRLLQHLRVPMPLRGFRDGTATAAHIYVGLSSKTIARDIDHLTAEKLVTVRDGVVSANLDVMRDFMP